MSLKLRHNQKPKTTAADLARRVAVSSKPLTWPLSQREMTTDSSGGDLSNSGIPSNAASGTASGRTPNCQSLSNCFLEVDLADRASMQANCRSATKCDIPKDKGSSMSHLEKGRKVFKSPAL